MGQGGPAESRAWEHGMRVIGKRMKGGNVAWRDGGRAMRRPKDELGTREMPSSVLACRPREGHAPDARHICFQSRISAGERGYVQRGMQGRKEATEGLGSQMRKPEFKKAWMDFK